MALAAEESAKAKDAKEVVKSLTTQLKDMAERVPPGVYGTESMRSIYLPNGLVMDDTPYLDANGECHSRSDSISSSYIVSPTAFDTSMINGTQGPTQSLRGPLISNETNQQNRVIRTSNGSNDHSDVRLPNSGGAQASSTTDLVSRKESGQLHNGDNNVKFRNSGSAGNTNQVETEWLEQCEPGVYITLVTLRDGTTDLKRVRFSRRKFSEHQAEIWWSENREKVYEKYQICGSDNSSVSNQAARRSNRAISPPSQTW